MILHTKATRPRRTKDTLESYAPSDRFGHEDNDCVVCAVATASEASYAKVHAMLKAAGRKDRRGFHTYRFFGREKTVLSRRFTYKETWNNGRHQTLIRFARENPKGRFLVTIPHHALCVIDGVIVESNSRVKRRASVRNAWRVEADAPKPIHPSIAAWDAFGARCEA